MANKKDNPLIGSFRADAPGTSPPGEDKKADEPLKAVPDPKAPAAAPAKAGEEKKVAEPPKAAPDPKAPDVAPAKAGKQKFTKSITGIGTSETACSQ